MTRLLMFAAPFALIAACWLIASRVGLPRVRRRQRVTQAWQEAQEAKSCVELRPIGRMEYRVFVDGLEVFRASDEEEARALKAELEEVRGEAR